MDQPKGGSIVALDGEWTTVRYQVNRGLELAEGVGMWLIEHQLYSQGNDFTSELARSPGHVGNSTLLKLWGGKESGLEDIHDKADIWVLMRKGKPHGVITWFHQSDPQKEWFAQNPDHPRHNPKLMVPVGRVGYVMAFMKQEARGKGLVRKTLLQHVLPHVLDLAKHVRSNHAIPLLGAGDGMYGIMERYTDLPLTSHMRYCVAMRSDVWSVVRERRMYPERVDPVDKYLVNPVPWVKPKVEKETTPEVRGRKKVSLRS